MPLFDFFCRDCEKEFEILLMGKEKPYCPHCQGDNLVKQMSVFAHRSKGSDGSTKSSSSGGGCSGCAGGSCSTC